MNSTPSALDRSAARSCVGASLSPVSTSAKSSNDGSPGHAATFVPGVTLSRRSAPASGSDSSRSTACGDRAHARSAIASDSAIDRSGVSLSTTGLVPSWRPRKTREVPPDSASSSSRPQRRQNPATSPAKPSHHGSASGPNLSSSRPRASASSTNSGSSMGHSLAAGPVRHNGIGHAEITEGTLPCSTPAKTATATPTKP
jgi:hypothetical protein